MPKISTCPFCESEDFYDVKLGFAELVVKYRSGYNTDIKYCMGCKRLILPR